MEYSTLEPWQEIGETGIIHDRGSLYGRFHHICDPRQPKGKQYSLVTLLVVIFVGKLVGKDKPDEIADWAKNHAEELAEMLGLRHLGCRRTVRSGECFTPFWKRVNLTAWRKHTINKNTLGKGKYCQWMVKPCGVHEWQGKSAATKF